MDVVSYFRAELETVGRYWLERLAAFDARTALARPAPNMNHAIWLTGHMIWAEDFLVTEVPTGQALRDKAWDVLFDHSSEKLPDDRYPALEQVRETYERVHEEVVKRVGALKPADLGRASVVERRWFPTAAHAIAHQVTHGHYHLGQFMYLFKLLQAGKL